MDPSREELAALDLDGVVAAVESQLRAGPLEVNIAGDVDPEELDAMITRYLGTAAPGGARVPQLDVAPPPSSPSPFARWRPAIRRRANSDGVARQRRASVRGARRSRSEDVGADAQPASLPPCPEAAAAAAAASPLGALANDHEGKPFNPADAVNVAAAAKGNPFAAQSARRANPLATFVAGMLLTEVIGGRLFTTVRDALGLTYDCNFQLAFGLQNSDATTYRLVVTSTPAKIDDALAAALRVLRGFQTQRISQREVNARRR